MIGVRQRSLGRLACQESLSYRCATRFLLALEKSCGGRLRASRAAWRFMGIGFGVGMGCLHDAYHEIVEEHKVSILPVSLPEVWVLAGSLMFEP